jgi:hypothetical protein
MFQGIISAKILTAGFSDEKDNGFFEKDNQKRESQRRFPPF